MENQSLQENQESLNNPNKSHYSNMRPTPTTQEIEHPQAELTESGRRKSKDGNSSHSLNLADSVKVWPTPRARDYKDGKKEGLWEWFNDDGSLKKTETWKNGIKQE